MKKTALITALLFFIAISGCTASKHYGEYVAAQTEVAKLQANEKPMVNISFTDSGGKPITLVVNMPKDTVKIEQVRKSEWVAPIISAFNTIGSVLGIYFVAEAVSDMFENAGSTTTTTTTTTTTSIDDTSGIVTIGDGNTTSTIGGDGLINHGDMGDMNWQPDNSEVTNN